MIKFLEKIAMTLVFLFVYVFGNVRTYTLFAKWTTFDNKVIPFDTVLLRNPVDLCSDDAMRTAVNQCSALTIMENSFKFDHLEPCPMTDFLNRVWYDL